MGSLVLKQDGNLQQKASRQEVGILGWILTQGHFDEYPLYWKFTLTKEYVSDPIFKQRRKNRGELPQYYVENTHEAIIDKETFDYVRTKWQGERH